MDSRLHDPGHNDLDAFLRSQGLKNWDLRTQQGAAKDLLPSVSGQHKQSLLDAIGISVKLHGVKTVFLMNHEDCGAYGGSKAFGNARTEAEKQAADLRAATETIRTAYPSVAVWPYYVRIDESSGMPRLSFDAVR